ncbi:hypothetical protein [Paraburkholderia atlantica]|uniref:hypothetical protein n=1 Tax=Paraburkholderia atlantica TaxID=2654982 RepID=UPI00185800B4|nr:hypothetical protein [Paraburkholderia atlantica]MBB5421656.1 hypothetical protein [Paraburkholderia atlantica]
MIKFIERRTLDGGTICFISRAQCVPAVAVVRLEQEHASRGCCRVVAQIDPPDPVDVVAMKPEAERADRAHALWRLAHAHMGARAEPAVMMRMQFTQIFFPGQHRGEQHESINARQPLSGKRGEHRTEPEPA